MRSQWYNIFADEKNPVDYSNVVRKDIRSVKSFLMIALIASLIANIVVTTIFGLSQGFSSIIICHIVLIVVDFIFFILMLALNFRFKNSKFWMPTYLSIATVLMITALVLPFVDQKHQSMTYLATGIYAAIDLIKILTVIYATIVAQKAVPTKNNKLVGILSSAFISIILFGYIVLVSFNGYFGQGINMNDTEATLVFSYENDCYTVVGKYDDGNIINIPNEFNGKQVKYIEASLVENDTVKTIIINNSDVRFSNLASVSSITDGLTIKCGIDDYNAVRRNLFIDLQSVNSTNGNLLNSFIPTNVEDNQVWVDFNYTGLDFSNQEYIESFSINYKDYSKLNGNSMLALMLKNNPSLKNLFKVSTDNMTDFMSLDNQLLLQDRFNNNGAKLLYQIEIIEKDATSSNVNFYFDDVHKLNISNGNDSKATKTIFNFSKLGYEIYINDSKAVDFYNSLPQRDGLSVSWQLNSNKISSADDFATSIDEYDRVTADLEPIWTMNVPKIISFASSSLNNQIIYGDDASFTCVAESDSKNPIALQFELYYAGGLNEKNTTGIFEYNKRSPLDSGTVYAKVKCYDPTISDLSSEYVSTSNIDFIINKKALPFSWTLDGSDYIDPITYDGNSHVVGCTFDSADLVYDDATIFSSNDYDYSIKDEKDAGNYIAIVTLLSDNGFSSYYTTDSNTSSFDFTINQKQINHTWENLTFEYNGFNQQPTINIATSEICGTDVIGIEIIGSGLNAGEYKASVKIDNDNYSLIESNIINDKIFTILKKKVEGIEFKYTKTTYSANPQYPTLESVDGLVNGEELQQSELEYTFQTEDEEHINVGTYNVICKFKSTSNYEFKTDNKFIGQYEIEKYELEVIWDNISKTYNGENQTATIIANGLLKDGIIAVVSGELKNVGSTNVTAVLNTENIKNTNYTLLNTTSSFTILKKEIEATWKNLTTTYNATAQKPVGSFASGVICGDDEVNININSKTNVDEYDLTAVIDNTNYLLTNANVKFTINKATAHVAWADVTSYEYDGETHTIDATVYGVNNVELTSNVTNSGKDYKDTPYIIEVSFPQDSLDSQNYNLDIQYKNLMITRKPLTINWSVSNYTYNGANQKPDATLNSGEIISGDEVTVSVVADHKDAGTYTAYASLSNNNYSALTPNQIYTINKKLVSITWTDTSLIYDTTIKKPTCNFANADIVGDDDLNPSYTNGAKNVGTYSITVSIDNQNYYLNEADVTTSFEIIARTLSSSEISVASISDQTYQGVNIEPALNVQDSTNSNQYLYKDTDYLVEFSNNMVVGTATASITLRGNYSGSKEVTFKIVKAKLTPYIVSVSSKQYNGTTDAQDGVLGLSGAKNSEQPTATGIFEWTNSDAGTKTLNVTSIILDSEWTTNYELAKNTLNSATPNNNASITRRILTEAYIKTSDDISSYVYSGSAIKPTTYVKDASNGNLQLVENEDYSISYSNNINVGTAYLYVTLIGNYSGTKTITFSIIAKAITPTIDSISSQTYTGNFIKPTICVKDDSKTLSASNYDVEYSNNKYVGTATVVVTLKGNYEGTNSITFEIKAKSITPKFSTVAKQEYTGSAISPKVVIYDGSVVVDDSNYTLSYSNNTFVGTAIITATLKNNYSGTGSTTFSIVAKTITPTIGAISSQTYTGSAITPNVVVKYNNLTLDNGTDYDVKYSNNINAGTATVTVTMKGNYSGTGSTTFSIVAKAITPTIDAISSQTYTGSAITPNVVVKYNSVTLIKGTDYDVKYSNNINVGTATITVTMKGNYSGSTTTTFSIVKGGEDNETK